MSEPKVRVPRGVRFFALVLALGGVYGVLIGLWTESQTLQQLGYRPQLRTAWLGLFIVLFGWSAWTGYELWKAKPSAFTRAKVLFAAQILNFSVPGFAFQGFWTGLRIGIAVSQIPPNLQFHADVSSSIYFSVSPEVDYWIFGINLFALVALLHLVHVTSTLYGQKPDRFGLI